MSETGAEHTSESHTGLDRVDRVIESLGGLDELPVDEHPAVFETVHGDLRSVLNGNAGA